ncbi:MAG: class I SAM-dependent methyltransferase [Rhodospirillum sp.]|nr:class I SAM-dependent methyltransferase [Rhodospirillum sp.]MCF8487635.1 class I SAM-dependent methyltransferase [Rhodospirillum sp.]MCF8499239.1 class I SAM-dependent methyltransferase [Rhodospirillum sp.]
MAPDSWVPLTPALLAPLFGGSAEDIQRASTTLPPADLALRLLSRARRDDLVQDTHARLNQGFPRSGENRLAAWERGWGENLMAFQRTGNLDALVPGYVRPGEILRFQGDYAEARSPTFLRDYIRLYRAWLIDRYFMEATAILEFGCGPCSHLAHMAAVLPGIPLTGLDWSPAAITLANEIGVVKSWPLRGHRFDFFSPDTSLRLAPGSVVLTFGALEQVGERHGPFLDFLLDQPGPLRVVHVEGFEDLYLETDPLDDLALRYHRARGYLSGLLPRLRQLDAEGRLRLTHVHRHALGTRFDDTFSLVVWEKL